MLKSKFHLPQVRFKKFFNTKFYRAKKNRKKVSLPFFLVRRPQFHFWHKYGALLSRVILIAFFIGLNISLGKAFLSQNTLGVPYPVASILLRYGIIPGEEVSIEKLTNPYSAEIVLTADDIIAELNKVRVENGLPIVTVNEKLATAAGMMLTQMAQFEYDLQAEGKVTPLVDVLDEVQYSYEWVHTNALVGPLSPEAVVMAWLSDEDQSTALLTEEFTEIGLAVEVVQTPFMGKAGAIVQLLAQPQKRSVPKNTVPATYTQQQNQPIVVEEFSDESVVAALNAYRSVHSVPELRVDTNLCVYAQKRVADLVAFGSLDGHAGFKKDFEAEEPPIGIREYSGTQIGENLASQYCLNGTTGEPIYATNPTQLIEWCFDSSQHGHREAQLSREYRDVCVRHGENMYVVIFGGA